MNCQEMETATRAGAAVVCLIFNDHTYGLIKWKQQTEFGRAAFVDFTNPDFVQLANSFGWEGLRVEAADELLPALESAFNAGKPALVDCSIDYSENLRLTDRLGHLVCPI